MPVSRGNNSITSSETISGDVNSFTDSQRGQELFYAPVGLYQVLLRAEWLHADVQILVVLPTDV